MYIRAGKYRLWASISAEKPSPHRISKHTSCSKMSRRTGVRITHNISSIQDRHTTSHTYKTESWANCVSEELETASAWTLQIVPSCMNDGLVLELIFDKRWIEIKTNWISISLVILSIDTSLILSQSVISACESCCFEVVIRDIGLKDVIWCLGEKMPMFSN